MTSILFLLRFLHFLYYSFGLVLSSLFGQLSFGQFQCISFFSSQILLSFKMLLRLLHLLGPLLLWTIRTQLLWQPSANSSECLYNVDVSHEVLGIVQGCQQTSLPSAFFQIQPHLFLFLASILRGQTVFISPTFSLLWQPEIGHHWPVICNSLSIATSLPQCS